MWTFGLVWLAALAALAGCVLGSPGDAGCTEDAECGEGFSCRAGACFREDNGGPKVAADGGDDAGDSGSGDGGQDAGDGGEDAADAEDAPSD